ncbi:MAG: DinB family protein [Cohaesibacter sp.]|jgi:uncharacterized damage-inducible protein DinB|nr:DinB family protein [Cohaesibacter sp.]
MAQSLRTYFAKLAHYNQWANQRFYQSLSELSEDELQRDLSSFFGSIHNTLNHVLVGDTLWMARFLQSSPPPWQLDSVPFSSFASLHEGRKAMDGTIISFFEADSQPMDFLAYQTMVGEKMNQMRSDLYSHFFNHQTHHRGQCHAMLTQLGYDAPPLDLAYFYREQ